MLLTTTDLNVEYEVLGIVRGNKVRSVHLGRDILAFFKNLTGGEVRQYAELMTGVRNAAMDEMIEEARSMGANAIIGICFTSSQVASGMAEILV